MNAINWIGVALFVLPIVVLFVLDTRRNGWGPSLCLLGAVVWLVAVLVLVNWGQE